MTENREEMQPPESSPAPDQDWSKIIEAGIITLVVLVVVVNLVLFKVPDSLLEKLAISPSWLQTARWSSLLLALGTSGLLLWQILRRQ